VGIGKETSRERSSAMYLSHWSSQATVARALYSASVELLETIFCFLDFHEIKQLP